jgi:hypothetical protein
LVDSRINSQRSLLDQLPQGILGNQTHPENEMKFLSENINILYYIFNEFPGKAFLLCAE